MPRFPQRQAVFLFSLLWVAGPTTGEAQFTLGGAARLTRPYVWRGLTRSNGPSMQFEGLAGLGLRRGTVSAGVWANVELGQDRSNWRSELGNDRPGVSETNIWGRFAYRIGNTTLFTGAIHYDYRGEGAVGPFTRDANTTEFFGGVQLVRGTLVPQVTAYVDVQSVDGVYFEGSLTAFVLRLPTGRLPIMAYVNALLGFSALEGANLDDPAEIALFQDESFTHLDISASFNIVLAQKTALTLNLEPHFELKFDEATRRTSAAPDDQDNHQQFWGTIALSFHPVIFRSHRGR